MTVRRVLLTVAIAGLLGSSSSAAFASTPGSDVQSKRVCVVGTDDPSHTWDGVCVWVPVS